MRWDSIGAGFACGMLAPVLGFFGYAGLYVTAIRPHHDLHWFVHDLFIGTPIFRPRVVSLSLIADAFLFFLFDRFDRHRAMRGVILAMVAYGVYITGALVSEMLGGE
jgi:hypothetical protein